MEDEKRTGSAGADDAMRELHELRARGAISEAEFEARKAGIQGAAKRATSRVSALAVTAFALSFILGPVGSLLGIAAVVVVATSKGRLRGLGFGISAICVGFFAWGMLAAIAVPSFINYMRRAKSSEARINLDAISRGATACFQSTGQLPASVDWTPASPCCQRDTERGKCRAAEVSGEWASPTWQALVFAPDVDFFYQYRFVSDGTAFTVEARGDLDCDGVTSLYSRGGAVGPDGALRVEPDTRETDPLE